MRIDGPCHCGNILIALDWGGDPREIRARACRCSFCVSHGAVWTCSPTSSLEVTLSDAAQVSRYAFGTRTAEFFVCAGCGVVPLATSMIDDRLYAVVNVNTLVGLDPSSLRRSEADFDGEATDARLARRKLNWIGDVRFVEG